MPNYNMTKLGNIETMTELFRYANDSTKVSGEGVLFGLISVAIFFIMLLALKRWEFDKAMLSSSFAMFILTLILTFIKLISFYFPLGFLIIMAFTGLYMYIANK